MWLLLLFVQFSLVPRTRFTLFWMHTLQRVRTYLFLCFEYHSIRTLALHCCVCLCVHVCIVPLSHGCVIRDSTIPPSKSSKRHSTICQQTRILCFELELELYMNIMNMIIVCRLKWWTYTANGINHWLRLNPSLCTCVCVHASAYERHRVKWLKYISPLLSIQCAVDSNAMRPMSVAPFESTLLIVVRGIFKVLFSHFMAVSELFGCIGRSFDAVKCRRNLFLFSSNKTKKHSNTWIDLNPQMLSDRRSGWHYIRFCPK